MLAVQIDGLGGDTVKWLSSLTAVDARSKKCSRHLRPDEWNLLPLILGRDWSARRRQRMKEKRRKAKDFGFARNCYGIMKWARMNVQKGVG